MNTSLKHNSRALLIILQLALVVILVAGTASGQETAVPPQASLLFPSGTISTAVPAYTWFAVPTATWYYLWVGDSVSYPKIAIWYTAAEAGCASGTGLCSVTPTIPLAPGAAQWWIQTWNTSGLGPWSAGMIFQAGVIPNSVTQIVLDQPSPNSLKFGQFISVSFSYTNNEAGGVRIWVRPFSSGALTPNYMAHPSPVYPIGAGKDLGWFSISSGQVIVDQIRIQMWSADQTRLLFETFLPVSYHYGN
jgi:hypothetical protein